MAVSKWSDPDRVLWLTMRTRGPVALRKVGDRGEYQCHLVLLSFRWPAISVMASHMIDEGCVEFSRGGRTSESLAMTMVSGRRNAEIIKEEVERTSWEARSGSVTVSTSTVVGRTDADERFPGPIGRHRIRVGR